MRLIGTTLDKYEVLQKVGEGGMATVYRGRHATLNRDVAIKVLHPHLSSSQRNRKRFAREARAIEQLRHDNILEIFDYSGLEASDCYIVTEFVEGQTLTSLLHGRGKLPSEIVTLIGVHVARALAYAHHQGILHRDLKTDNIMVRTDGTVKLMDFGIARFLDESQVTMTGALVGSPAFMSPEQAKEGKLDLRSDLFSLGTVLFYLATGHLPFSGNNPSLILKNVIEGNRPNVAELAPTLSASLADVIERLMATDPEDRQNTAMDVERTLLACLSEARIDPLAPEWELSAYIHGSEEYEARLEEHLKKVLVEEGRARLATGDHLAALRLFNRLLSMDEQNDEVLALVQGLHRGEARRSQGQSARLVAAGALVVILIGSAGLWVASKRTLSPPAPDPERVAVSVALPVELPPMPVPSVVAPVPVPAPAAPSPRPVGATPAPPAPLPIEEPSINADDPAIVFINTGEYHADVYLGGHKIGSTRFELPIPAGTQELTIQSPLFFAHTETVTLAPGETKTVTVDLQVRPSRIVFPMGWDPACHVRSNDALIGTIAELSRILKVDRPDQPIRVQLDCPNGTVHTQEWPNVRPRGVEFPAPDAP